MSENLPNGERKVLLALRFLAGEESRVTVSGRDLATALGWTRTKSVRQCAVNLERRGLVSVTNNSTPGTHRPNTFTVLPLGREVAENIEAMEAA